MNYVFIETKYIYFKEIESYIDNSGISIKLERITGEVTYARRYYIQGILIPIPKFLSRYLYNNVKYFTLIKTIGCESVLFGRVKKKRVSLFI